MSYRADGRDAAALVAELARSARGRPAYGLDATWADVLFADEGLRDESEPSQALLLAVAREAESAVAHLDELPARAREWFLETRLGIERLPVVPDRVVAVVDGDPKRLPVTLPRGSRLKAGKGPLGDRMYATAENLVVIGTPIAGAHTYRVPATGIDTVARHSGPLGAAGPADVLGPETSVPAPHELVLASDLLRLDSGTAAITLTFSGVTFAGATPQTTTQMLGFFKALRWQLASGDADGYTDLGVQSSASTALSADSVRITLAATGASLPQPVAGTPLFHLRAIFPDEGTAGFSRALAFGLGFRSVSLVLSGVGVQPQAGYANDGLLDLTKEFKPFGPVPRRGDAFYLRSDEAFGKPLTSVTVQLEELETTSTYKGVVYEKLQDTQLQMAIERVNAYLDEAKAGVSVSGASLGIDYGTATPKIRWDRKEGDDWTSFAQKEQLASFTQPVTSTKAFSAPAVLGGAAGHAIRAFLHGGDFGWEDYQQTLADNAYWASNDHTRVQSVTPPAPPVVSRVRISYTTREQSSATGTLRVFARNGLARAADVTGSATIAPYAAGAPDSSTLFVGLDDSVPLGELVSLYLDIDAAHACDPAELETTVVFRYDGGAGGWKQLDLVDGTLGLQQSGVLRFVAPLDWAAGSDAVDEAAGRWLQAYADSVNVPERVLRVATDAVEAVYLLAPGHEDDDPTPATPLPAGAVTGLAVAVPGIRALTNPKPSWGGRGPEPTAAFFARASGVTRHRNRAVTAWDAEELVRSSFPDVALVRCLPHHSATSECRPGSISLVVVPRSDERMPVATVQLAASIRDFVRARATSWLSPVVLCPAYEEVGVRTTLKLVPGAPGGDARRLLEQALRDFLHPLRTTRRNAGFGNGLYRSELVRFFESHPLVLYVEDGELEFTGVHAGLERIDVDECRGLIASAAEQSLTVEASL